MYSLTTFTEWERWSTRISKSVTAGAIPFPMIYLGSEYSFWPKYHFRRLGFDLQGPLSWVYGTLIRHDSRHQYFNWPFDWRHKSFWIPGEQYHIKIPGGERSVFDKVREGELEGEKAKEKSFIGTLSYRSFLGKRIPGSQVFGNWFFKTTWSVYHLKSFHGTLLLGLEIAN